MRLHTTHTFATLEVSKRTYDEIKQKLLKAAYGHTIIKESESKECIDMHGIALVEHSKERP